jgi:hypothetical protein
MISSPANFSSIELVSIDQRTEPLPIPGITWQITPLVLLTVESLINMIDPCAFLTAQTEYSIAPDLYLDTGAFIGVGRKPTARAGEVPVDLKSEFGSYPNIHFASLRYYF